MATECIVKPVYRTTCNRCGQVLPATYEARHDWVTLEVRGAGAPEPQADLCPPCKIELGRFMEGKAIDAAHTH